MGGGGGGAGCSGDNSPHGFSDESLNEHYAKHGKSFGSISKKDYENNALHFRDAIADVDIEYFSAPNGSTYKFNSRTNEFMVYMDTGEIITYFKPDNPAAYWMTQRVKYE